MRVFQAVGLEFFTLRTRTYQLQYSDDLENWTDDGEPFAGVSGWSTLYRPAESSVRYWRLALR